MSNLLYPGTMSGAPMPQPAPTMTAQQMAQPGFAQRFKGNLGPILQALGYGIAAGDLSKGIPLMQQGMMQRREQAEEQQKQAGAQAEEQQKANATVEWLKARNRPDLAGLVMSGAIEPMQAVQEASKSPEQQQQPASVQEYEYARENGFGGSFMDFQEGKRGQGVTYGTTPQWFKDKKTLEWKFGVIGSDGTFKNVQTEEGVKLEGPEGVAAARAHGTVTGEMSGKAAGSLPIASGTAQRALKLADEIMASPNFDSSVGPIEGRLPDLTAGRADFASRVQQLKDLTFMQARQELKGGGAITDFEGQKAENALLRASRATSEQDYRTAMIDYKAAIIKGYQMLEEQAGMTGGNVPQSVMPPAGANAPRKSVSEMSDAELGALANGG